MEGGKEGRKGKRREGKSHYTTQYMLSSVSQRRQIALMKAFSKQKGKCMKYIF